MNASIYAFRDENDAVVLWAREDVHESPETTGSWQVVHEQLRLLGKNRAAHEHALCRWLLAAERLAVHRHLSGDSFASYAFEVTGLEKRPLDDRLRVGRALAELPALDRALAAGDIFFSAAKELTRIATRETEEEWLAWAKGRSSRQIERAVARRDVGARPSEPGDPARERHRLSFEVWPETMALFRDLQAAVRVDLGDDIDDDTLLFEIARRALGGPEDEGRASYQVAVSRCDDCGRSSIDAGGEVHTVDETVAEMVDCDSQELGPVDAPKTHVGARAAQNPAGGAPSGDAARA